jgi:hypothetical protein
VAQARLALGYRALADRHLEGNCDRLTAHQLHQKAWPIMQQFLEAKRKRHIERMYAESQPVECASEVGAILRAATEGQVRLLLAASDAKLYGAYVHNSAEDAVRLDPPANDDLVDLAAANTLRHGGEVFVVDRQEIPDRRDMVALLRKSAPHQKAQLSWESVKQPKSK